MIFNQSHGDRKVRVFSISPSFLEQFQDKQPNWGFGELGYFTYKRTYARDLEKGGTEEFWQTCRRVVEGVYNIQKIHCKAMGLPWIERKAQRSAQNMYQRMWDFKFLPPGRGLWMMGTDLVYQRGSAALQNCAFVSTDDIDTDFADPFCFLMDMSMLGVGVGGDTRGAGKVRINVPRMSKRPFVVKDSREGWVDLIKTVLNSFVGKGYFPLVVDFTKVRGRGTPIKGFGGVSSGPGPLCDLMQCLTLLLMPEGKDPKFTVKHDGDGKVIKCVTKVKGGRAPGARITSAQIVDIFNYIGKCVVAGGVRRTAEIMFGNPEDQEFMSLKQDKDALSDRRWASNNSVFAKVGMDYAEVAEAMAVNGEPGICWLENARNFSRMGHDPDGKDWRAMGTNPCGEQTLEHRELCNLVETFPAHHDDYEDYQRTLKMAYLYAKSVTLVPTHDPRTNAVMQRNRRIGCSVGGIIQAFKRHGRRNVLTWCDQGYGYIQELDRLYSGWLGVHESIKTTSIKPSGTVSLLTGSTPGMHYPHAEYYIRNVRVANTSPLVDAARRAGYPVEADAYADDTSVVSFPVKEKHFIKGKADATMWEQFTNAADIQQHWADNQVSVTVSFQARELRDIQTCLEAFENRLKSITLMPLEDHGYVQAPYIKITSDQYADMMSRITPLQMNSAEHEITDAFCDGDSCTIPVRDA